MSAFGIRSRVHSRSPHAGKGGGLLEKLGHDFGGLSREMGLDWKRGFVVGFGGTFDEFCFLNSVWNVNNWVLQSVML